MGVIFYTPYKIRFVSADESGSIGKSAKILPNHNWLIITCFEFKPSCFLGLFDQFFYQQF